MIPGRGNRTLDCKSFITNGSEYMNKGCKWVCPRTGKRHVKSKYYTTSIETQGYFAVLTDEMSFPYLCNIITATDDGSRRGPQGTNCKLLCGIIADSWTDFFILDNSNCCTTNWSLNLENGSEYTLCINKINVVNGKERTRGHAGQFPNQWLRSTSHSIWSSKQWKHCRPMAESTAQ